FNAVEPLDPRNAKPARHNEAQRRAMPYRQGLAIHFVRQEDFVAQGIGDAEAAGKVLFVLLVADFLGLFVKTEKDDFDPSFQWRTFFKQRREPRPGPAHIPDGAHESGAAAV